MVSRVPQARAGAPYSGAHRAHCRAGRTSLGENAGPRAQGQAEVGRCPVPAQEHQRLQICAPLLPILGVTQELGFSNIYLT